MKKNYFLSLIIFLIPLIGFAQASTKTKPIEWTTFQNKQFEIKYPKHWDLDTSHQMQTEFILFSQQEDGLDLFKENVNFIIQDFGSINVTLDQYVEGTENQIKTMFKDGKLLSSERLTKDGKTYHRMVYIGTMPVGDLKFEQLFWIDKHRAYMLTLTCAQDKFDAYQVVGEKILNSFSF